MQFSLLETGGTINGILRPGDESPAPGRVEAWLHDQRSRLDIRFDTEYVCMKDSRAITDRDRERLLLAIERRHADRILIPHGTYTMPDTGVYLLEKGGASILEKSIVLTGSLVPLNETGSDAPDSLELALQVLRERPPGVWIVIQGAVWAPREVRKDRETGRYVRITGNPDRAR